jgi:hypothetical protein
MAATSFSFTNALQLLVVGIALNGARWSIEVAVNPLEYAVEVAPREASKHPLAEVGSTEAVNPLVLAEEVDPLGAGKHRPAEAGNTGAGSTGQHPTNICGRMGPGDIQAGRLRRRSMKVQGVER